MHVVHFDETSSGRSLPTARKTSTNKSRVSGALSNSQASSASDLALAAATPSLIKAAMIVLDLATGMLEEAMESYQAT